MSTQIRVKVFRQSKDESSGHWDSFEVPFRPNMNVISVLMEIRKSPVTTDGQPVSPPVWEAACLEEVCGSCTMNVNGNVRQACSALIEDVGIKRGDDYELSLEPMHKFPLVKDLQVDRGEMFDNLIRLRGWVPIDGSYDRGPAEPQDDHIRQLRYALSRCMTCGCCMEACPQFNEKTTFVGPAAIGQALLFNIHPVGKTLVDERMDLMTSQDGITNCGNAQNCVKVCPKGLPLTEAIAQMNRDTTVHKLKEWAGIRSR